MLVGLSETRFVIVAPLALSEATASRFAISKVSVPVVQEVEQIVDVPVVKNRLQGSGVQSWGSAGRESDSCAAYFTSVTADDGSCCRLVNPPALPGN